MTLTCSVRRLRRPPTLPACEPDVLPALERLRLSPSKALRSGGGGRFCWAPGAWGRGTRSGLSEEADLPELADLQHKGPRSSGIVRSHVVDMFCLLR